MLQVLYKKLADHKGAKRVWLEGWKLAQAGFIPGVRYRISLDHTQKALVLELTDGAHVVSRKRVGEREVPVVDICNRDLATLFGEKAERVKVEIAANAIRVTIHPDDAAALERAVRLMAKIKAGAPLNVGSVAHGGGILDHAVHEGLQRAGVASRLAFAIEVEHDYIECAIANNEVWDAQTFAIEAPMEEVEPHILPKVEMLTAGLPCTGASLSGRAKNGLKFAEQHETAGALFLAFLNIVKATQPATILLENVPVYENTVSFHVITQALVHWGYDIHKTALDGNELGALESRKRLCMVAVTKGVAFDFSKLVAIREKEPNLGAVLEDLPPEHESWKPYEYLAAKEARDIEAGKGFRRQLLGPEASACGTVGAGYFKARSTEPFVRHPSGNGRSRLFTPTEHAKVKTIPAHLVKELSSTTAHDVLGQSIIWSAFVAVGELLGRSLKGFAAGVVAAASSATVADAKSCDPVQGSLFGAAA